MKHHISYLILSALLPAPLASLRATDNNSVAHPANVLEAGEPAARQRAVLTQKDVLSIRDRRLYLESKPFAEISFNKFDLFWQLYDQLTHGKPLTDDNPMVQTEARALRNLHELGFRSIRIFGLPWGPSARAAYEDPSKREMLYAAIDKTLEVCDRHGIRLVWCLAAGEFTDTRLVPGKGWVFGDEQLRELVADRNSRGRRLLYRYLDETVSRYRNRKTIMMWEITNELTLNADIGDEHRVHEGQRMPTLKDVAGFYDDVAKRIKASDPVRLVNNGGSDMREHQWHLYQRQGWIRDTFTEQSECYKLLFANSAVDVMDIHFYPNNQPGQIIRGDNAKETILDCKGYMTIAGQIGKPLMIGELGLAPAARTDTKTWAATTDYFESYANTAAALPWVKRTLDN
jgi:sugar phosphate isomerase/epimerase